MDTDLSYCTETPSGQGVLSGSSTVTAFGYISLGSGALSCHSCEQASDRHRNNVEFGKMTCLVSDLTCPGAARHAKAIAVARIAFMGTSAFTCTVCVKPRSQCQVAGFFILPETHSNGRIDVLSLPAGPLESARRVLQAGVLGSERKLNSPPARSPKNYASGHQSRHQPHRSRRADRH